MYSPIINLIRTITDDSPNIRSFHYGDINIWIDAMRSDIDYPCVYMQDPVYTINVNDSMVNDISLSILFLQDVEVDNQIHQSQIMAKLQKEAKNYLRIISNTLFDVGVDILGNARLDPVASVAADNLIGWELQLTVRLDEANCIDLTFAPEQPFPLMFEIEPNQLNYIPTPSGNTQNLNKVVTAADGSVWLIDFMGRALNLNVTSGDIEITNQARGLILRSDPSDIRFRIGVKDDDGDLTSDPLS